MPQIFRRRCFFFDEVATLSLAHSAMSTATIIPPVTAMPVRDCLAYDFEIEPKYVLLPQSAPYANMYDIVIVLRVQSRKEYSNC